MWGGYEDESDEFDELSEEVDVNGRYGGKARALLLLFEGFKGESLFGLSMRSTSPYLGFSPFPAGPVGMEGGERRERGRRDSREGTDGMGLMRDALR